MAKPNHDEQQRQDLLLQMMNAELGGEQVYRTALTEVKPVETAIGASRAEPQRDTML